MTTTTQPQSAFAREFAALINRHSLENGSNTPDFILAGFVEYVIQAYNAAVRARAEWYGRMDVPGQSVDRGIAPACDPNMPDPC